MPLGEWAGFIVLGAAFGLALLVTANPHGSALPKWFPRAKNAELTHALYGASIGLLGVVFVELAGRVLGVLYVLLGELAAAALVLLWTLIVTGLALSGSEGQDRRRIFRAHATMVVVLLGLVIVGIVLGRLSVFRSL